MSMAGIAHTAVGQRNVEVDPEEQIREHLRMVGTAPEHDILVVEANDTISARIGELITTSLASQHCCRRTGIRHLCSSKRFPSSRAI